MVVYQCQDNLESIFTAIYNTYADHCSPEDTRIALQEEILLFSENRTVEMDPIKAFKVSKTLKERFGEENYYDICMALTSYHPEKADAVYHTIALGLREKPPRGHLLDNLANDHVNLVFKLARNASREHHHYLGFVRFEEKENGVLYARISPKCNIIMFLMPHFADRLPAENFVIYDENHGMFGVHPAKEEWYLVSADESETLLQMGDTDEEKGYQDLFRYFCERITIESRRNPALQRNMLPIRFRGNMTEFQRESVCGLPTEKGVR